MARTGSEANLKLIAGGYGGLRGWIEQVERMGELKRVNGASWDVEMGAITHMLTEHSHGTAPALLFDNIPGYPRGHRILGPGQVAISAPSQYAETMQGAHVTASTADRDASPDSRCFCRS